MASEHLDESVSSRKKPSFSGGRTYMRKKLQGKAFVVPSMVTVGSIFCGFVAIILAFKGNAAAFEAATKYIALAIIFDGLDGRVARRLNATSVFGMEFDSLSDVVSFGVAPAVLTFSWAFSHNYDELGVLVGFVYIVCGATRLARFNVGAASHDDSAPHTKGFVGLPIPGAAAAIASVIYCFPEPLVSPSASAFMLFYMLLVGILMVTTLPFFSVKNLKLSGANPAVTLAVLAIAVGLLWKFSGFAILVGCTFYALSGLAAYVWLKTSPGSYRRVVGKFRKTVSEEEDEAMLAGE
jgi:CDP-diacylglycerol--serine O-phosphatidyltransferase